MWAAGALFASLPQMFNFFVVACAFFFWWPPAFSSFLTLPQVLSSCCCRLTNLDAGQAKPSFRHRLVLWTYTSVRRRRDLYVLAMLISTGIPVEVTRFRGSNGKHGEGYGVFHEVAMNDVSVR